MANNLVKWAITTSAAYGALETKDPNYIYFLQDTGEIYRGAVSFSEAVKFVASFPAKGAQGKIYVDEATLEGKVWNGTAWKTVIQPVEQTVTASGTRAVSGKAVTAYVAAEFSKQVAGKFVEGIGYDKATKDLTFVKNGVTNKVAIDGFVTGAKYAGDTGVLSFTVEGGETISINLPKEDFVSSGHYDTKTQEIVLVLTSGGEVRIPAADLVDIYTVTSTATVAMAMNGNAISANVKVSASAGNNIVAKSDGLFVQATDISGKMNKVASGKAGELLIAAADGHSALSGIKAGAAALGSTPNATTLATEKAVADIRASLQAGINERVAKADITQSIGASGAASTSKVASQKAVALGIEALEAKVVAKSSIATSLNAAAPSATKVTSEAAVVEAMSWVVI